MDKQLSTIPQRLMNDEFIDPAAHFHIYTNTLDAPYKLHWHEFYEIEFILKGSGINRINGISYTMTDGSFFLLTPADFHELAPVEGAKVDLINVRFSDEIISQEMREILFSQKKSLVTVFKGEDFSLIRSDMEDLIQERDHSMVGRMLMIKGTLERMLIRLVRSLSSEQLSLQEGSPSKKSIHQSLIYIHNHFRESITLKDAANQSHLSMNYFSERFHQETGMTFQCYLQELRLQFAASLLISSSVPVTEVCFVSGFNSLTHFLRVFRQKYQCTPSSYRKKDEKEDG